MKLREVKPEVMLDELQRGVESILAESITEYLSTVIAHLKSKERHDLFNTEKPLVSLKQLASIIAGLKILSDHEYRSTLTKDDIRINPNSSMQLFNLLDSVPRSGRGTPKLTQDVFKALQEVAPKIFTAEIEKLKPLKSAKEAERQTVIRELEKFSEKVGKMFNKVRSIAHGEEESE